MFYEMEYDSPASGNGKSTQEPQKIEQPQEDGLRNLFTQMRDIARIQRATYDYTRFFDRRVRQDNSLIFYEQGMFMKDFTDSYEDKAAFSQYFPYYQMMGYGQLRTYFTWRTQVRKGDVTDTSLSYAFLYIYELLGNIGVGSPQDGLQKLVFFWKHFGAYNISIDKYVLQWLKDYHVYYALPQSWGEFVEQNGLGKHFPKATQPDSEFDLFCSVSKYDIKKSVFYSDETSELIRNCFAFVMARIRQDFETAGMHFDTAFFRPTRRLAPWKPFRDALFHSWLKQPDRRVVLSESEIYICKNNQWTFSTLITTEKGRQFIGFVLKRMESVLRAVTKYKFKITANMSMVHEETTRRLEKSGLFIEKIVPAAALEFYREATKTVVTVDHASLDRIRQEALVTQEALIVEENAQMPEQSIFADAAEPEPVSTGSVWDDLKDALSQIELQALSVISQQGDIKAFADECGIMLEVLVDGINEKAMDYIGDNLMDEEFVLYDDYIENVGAIISRPPEE